MRGDNFTANRLSYKVKYSLFLFYDDYDLMFPHSTEWDQGYFDTLIKMFGRVGLRTNTYKTNTMICMTGYISVRQFDY